MKNKKNKPSTARKIVPLAHVISTKIANGNLGTITFEFRDGSKLVQKLRPEFIKSKTVNTIIADIKAIQWDLQAKYFTL